MKEEESATQLVWWSERQLTRLFSVGGKKQINIARQTLPKFQISSASVQYTPQLRNHPHHAVSYTDPDLRCHWLRNERGYRLDRMDHLSLFTLWLSHAGRRECRWFARGARIN